jgi:guanine deaminase
MLKGIRGTFLDFVDDPFYEDEKKCIRFLADGLLVIENGTIKELGLYENIIDKYRYCRVEHYPGYLILPGFIDAHVHYSQMKIIASYGKKLLDWLGTYVFPEENKFRDYEYARVAASLFLEELLRNGTTTAAVFTTVHSQSVDAFFEESIKRNMRMIAGKVMMNRQAPHYLLDTTEQSYEESKRLIRKWHGNGRQLYAVTPRFAITSTRQQLDIAGRLKEEFPGVYIHTHLAENVDEIRLTLDLFPGCADYVKVYEESGLVTNKSIFAHGIHLSDSEMKRLSNAGSTIAFCPTSNLFLGSGLFNLAKAKSRANPVHVGVGTDVGAGTTLSLLRTMDEAYKVLGLQNQKLSAFKGFYLLTLGGARGLSLEGKIGNFDAGKEADIVVLDPKTTTLQQHRNSHHPQPLSNIRDVSEQLFALMCLGDERVVVKTYVAGSALYSRSMPEN